MIFSLSFGPLKIRVFLNALQIVHDAYISVPLKFQDMSNMFYIVE